MATQKKIAAPPEKLAHYQRLLDSVAGIESKSNFGSAYTAVNGNMYSMISKYGVVGIRLPEPERAEFLKEYEAKCFGLIRPGRLPRSTSLSPTTCWPTRPR